VSRNPLKVGREVSALAFEPEDSGKGTVKQVVRWLWAVVLERLDIRLVSRAISTVLTSRS